ncbi:hypothetical protein ACHAQC_008738 [Fusarium culmorum]
MPPTDIDPDACDYDPITGAGFDDDFQDVHSPLPPPVPWLPRSQEDERFIAASYDAGFIEDQHGDAVKVLADGDYYLKVWYLKELTQSNGKIARVRKTLVPMRCAKVLARCTRPGPQKTTKVVNCQSIGANRLDENTAPKAVAVGYSGITGCPVFATPPPRDTVHSTIDMNDNSKGIPFRTEPRNRSSSGNVIWHETSTVPGNISAIKRLVVSNDRDFIDDDDVVSTITQQHKRLNLGLSFELPAHHTVAEDGR